MTTIDLVQPNSYDISNNDTGHANINLFINQSTQLEKMWGYQQMENISFVSKTILATLVESNRRYIILADIDGLMIVEKKDATGFILAYQKLLFKDARWKDESGNDKYGNGEPYLPVPNKVSLMENNLEMIFATDGSVGGCYILIIGQNRQIYWKQLDYANIGNDAPEGYVKPYIDGTVVHLINPCSMDFLNPHPIFIDNRPDASGNTVVGYMYVLSQLNVKYDDSGALVPDYSKAQLTQPYSMINPIIEARVVNGIVYAISYNRIDLYQYGDVLPLYKVQNATIEIGCIARNLITTFNGKLIFIGSSKDKRFALNVIIGGGDITEFNKNNISYIFTHYVDKIDKLTVSAFGTHYQEFIIINGFDNLSLLVDVTAGAETAQNSYFIQDTGGSRFPADDIFQFNNDYYFVSNDNNYVYAFSDKINHFNGQPIISSVKSRQYMAQDPHRLVSIGNSKVSLQALLEDSLGINITKLAPYLEEKGIVSYEIYIKGTGMSGWQRINDEYNFFTILNDSPSDFIANTILVDTRAQIKFVFHPKVYNYFGVDYYAPIIINILSIDAVY